MNDYKSQKIMIFKIVNIGRNAMKTKHRVDNFEAKRHQVVKRVNEEDKEELDINIGSNQSVNRFNKRLKINKLH